MDSISYQNYRQHDEPLNERTESRKSYICEKHFTAVRSMFILPVNH